MKIVSSFTAAKIAARQAAGFLSNMTNQSDDGLVSPRKFNAQPSPAPINLTGIKANVPSHIVHTRPKKETEEVQNRNVINPVLRSSIMPVR